MAKADYYEILGISRNAKDNEIKKAYKRQAMKFHPDRNQGNTQAESKFKEIKEAYEVLSDPNKRSTYDQLGHSAFKEHNSFGNNNYSSNSDFNEMFGDVFSDIFGNNNTTTQSKGSDLKYDLELSLEEAVFGITKKINIPSLVKCNLCFGSGMKFGAKAKICFTCNGKGQIQMRQGFFIIQQTCHTCNGEGKFIKDPCYQCGGNGTIQKIRSLSVKIPSGVDTGDRIRLPGEGEYKKEKNNSGDLYINIKVKRHDIFERNENNLYCNIPISFIIATLGGEIEVPTLYGKIKLNIPSETQTNKIFRIKGKGIKSVRNYKVGDLLCKVIIETPIKLNKLQKKLLFTLGNSFNNSLEKQKNTPKIKNFLYKIKKFFNELKI